MVGAGTAHAAWVLGPAFKAPAEGSTGSAGCTTPTIFSFCFFPRVPRALRVAWRLAIPVACAATVVDLFFGVNPKSATVALLLP